MGDILIVDYEIRSSELTMDSKHSQRLTVNPVELTRMNESEFSDIYFSSRCLFLVVTFILILSVPLSAWAEKTPNIDLTPEEQAWLAEHPEIVLGTTTEYSPMVIKRSDGTHVGMLVDIYEQISRRRTLTRDG